MTRYQNPVNIPDEHMRLVGIIASHWQRIEAIMQDALATVLEAGGLPFLLVAHSTFEFRMNMLQAYGLSTKKKDEKIWKEFQEILQDIRNVNELRNTYVHALWNGAKSPPTRLVILLKKGKITTGEFPTPENDLSDAAERLWRVHEKLKEFCSKHALIRS